MHRETGKTSEIDPLLPGYHDLFLDICVSRLNLRGYRSCLLILIPGVLLNAKDDRPNAVFVVVDDRNDWIACPETTPRALAPNIDTLASQACNFMDAHTTGVYGAPRPLQKRVLNRGRILLREGERFYWTEYE